MRVEKGFTLIELMIVVVVIGILAAIAIPNFISLQRRAKEGTVKANMHTLQVVMEDFSIQSDGFYATAATDVTPSGRNIAQLCPTGTYPVNPFTKVASVVQWGANPSTGNPGEIAFNPAISTSYMLKGNGALGDTLKFVLTTGQ